MIAWFEGSPLKHMGDLHVEYAGCRPQEYRYQGPATAGRATEAVQKLLSSPMLVSAGGRRPSSIWQIEPGAMTRQRCCARVCASLVIGGVHRG